jgi:hypothetical protein
MKFLNWLTETAKKFSDFILKKLGKKLNKDGSKKFGTEKEVKKVILSIGAGFMIVLTLMVFSEDNTIIGSGFKEFEKQKGVKFGIAESRGIFSGQEISLEGLEAPQDIYAPREGVLNDTLQQEMACSNYHDKVRSGVKLSQTEFMAYQDCLDKGLVRGLTEDQRKAYKMLADPNANLTAEERALISKLASGELDPNSDEYKIAKALMSDDPFEREVARKLLDPNLSPEERATLLGFLDGTVPREVAEGLLSKDPNVKATAMAAAEAIKKGANSPEAQKALQNLRSKLAEEKLAQGTELSPEEVEALQQEQERLGKANVAEKAQLAEKERFMDSIKDAFERAMAKAARGETLTPEEEAIIASYKKAQEEIEALKTSIAQKELRLKQIRNLAMDAIEKGAMTGFGSNLGSLQEYEPPKEVEVEVVNRKNTISPSEFELIRRMAKSRRGTDFDGSLFPNLPPEAYNGAELKAESMNSARLSDLKNYNLDPTLKIPCETRTELLVSKDDAGGRRVVCVFLDNVYHPLTNAVLIPKGAKAVGETTTFDSNTELMAINFTQVVSGTQRIQINFMLVNAMGRQGLPGRVMSTRNKKITAAVITEFVSGVVQYFSRMAQVNIAQAGATNLNLMTNIMGSTSLAVQSGLSEVTKAIASDLQNSPDIFYTPMGHQLHLMPL